MLDASQNAVLTVDGNKEILRKMAIMGLNTLIVDPPHANRFIRTESLS